MFWIWIGAVLSQAQPLPPALEPSATPELPENACVYDTEGDLQRCERFYWLARAVALAVPSYVLSTDGATARHGLMWTLSIDVPVGEWSQHFRLGMPEDSVPGGLPAQLGVNASAVWFPGRGWEARLVLRTHFLSLWSPRTPTASWVHFAVAAGGTVGSVGFAPRIELRIRLGHLAWGGAVVAFGFQPYLSKNLYLGDLGLGVEAPWVWWW